MIRIIVRVVPLLMIDGFLTCEGRYTEKQANKATTVTEPNPVKTKNYLRPARHVWGEWNEFDEPDNHLALNRNRSKNEKDAEELHFQQKMGKLPIPVFKFENEFEEYMHKVSLKRHSVNSEDVFEDGDFNLLDYEFDVVHDDFVGGVGGRPAVPKVFLGQPEPVDMEEGPLIKLHPFKTDSTKAPAKEFLIGTYKPHLRDEDDDHENKV